MSTDRSSRTNAAKWYIKILIAAALIGVGLFFLQGWLRSGVLTSLARAYHGYEASLRFKDEVDTLRDPLDTLGFKNVTSVPSKCANYQIYGYDQPQLLCTAEYQNYVMVGNDQSSKALFNAKAKELEQLMSNDGWTTTSKSAPNLSQWFDGILSGKDWYSDIDSIKNIGNEHCSLVFSVAYSSPKPPAFQARMSCTAPLLEKTKNNVQET